MNCSELFEQIGMKCKSLPATDGSMVHCLSTPFEYFDGDGIHIYAEEIGSLVRFFDSGDTLFHLSGSGIRFKDKRNLKPLQKAASLGGATLSDDGEISVLVPKAKSREGFKSAMAAILNIAAWESENAGLSSDSTSLANEVEIYLLEWKPGMDFLRDQSLTGISGRAHNFSFLLDGELIDVVSSSPQATAAEVRKLADVRGIPSQAETSIIVVIDDRLNPARAKQEAMILSRFADVWPLTSLQNAIANPQRTMN